MTPYGYAKKEYLNGSFPVLSVLSVADKFLICDGDWNILETKTSFNSRDEALIVISKTLDKTRKFIVTA
jgi:hypothetical protein